MNLGVLDAAWFTHPCELAFDVFLKHRDAGSVAYLVCDQDSARQAGTPTVRGFVQKVGRPDGKRTRSASDPFELLVQSSMQLPIDDAACELLVLRCTTDWFTVPSLLAALLPEAARTLAPHGEMLLLWRERSQVEATGKSLPGAVGRWLDRLRELRRAMDRRWQRALQGVLRDQGFEHTEWLAPQYTASGLPGRIHLLRVDGSTQSRRSRRDQLRVNALRSVAVRASRRALPASWLQLATESVRESLALPDATLYIDNILVSPKEKVVILGSLHGSDIVIRVPLSPSALSGCQCNMQVLRQLRKQERLAGLTPLPITESEVEGRYLAVESRVRGTPARHLVQDETQLKLVERLLYALNPQHDLEMVNLQDGLYGDHVSVPLEQVASKYLDDDRRRSLERLFRRALYDGRVASGLSHGDFSVRNIYLNDGAPAGLIDWDDASIQGLPVLDAIGHLLSRQSRRGRGFADGYRRLATRQWPHDYELDFLDRCYAYYGVEPQQHVAYVALHWLRVIGNQLHHWFAQDQTFGAQYVDELADFFAGHADQVSD